MNIIIKAKGFIDGEKAPFIKVNDKYLFEYTLETARKIGYDNIYIDTDFREEVAAFCKDRNIKFTFIENVEERPMDCLVIDTLSVYDPNILKRLIKRGVLGHINRALIWDIRDKDDIKKTVDYFTKLTWNPLARYYVVPLGEGLARFLSKKTNVTPNQVTLCSFIIGIAASILFSFNNYYFGIVAALSLQLFHAFDVADGYLARLKNITSGFGGFCDGVVDQIVMTACVLGITIGVQKEYQSEWVWIIGFLIIFGLFMQRQIVLLRHEFIKPKTNEVFTYKYAVDSFKRKRLNVQLITRIYLFLGKHDVRIFIISLGAIFNKLIFVMLYLVIMNNVGWILHFVYIYLKRECFNQ